MVYFFLLQSLLAEHNRFRLEDIPPHFEEKKHLMQLYDELKVSYIQSLLLVLFSCKPSANIVTITESGRDFICGLA